MYGSVHCSEAGINLNVHVPWLVMVLTDHAANKQEAQSLPLDTETVPYYVVKRKNEPCRTELKY